MSEIEVSDDEAWRVFVGRHPQGLIYHRPEWLHVLQREYGCRVTCLVCRDGSGEIHGVLPLAWTKGLPFTAGARTGRRLSSLPRTPVAGPLALHEHAVAALVGAAVDIVRDIPGATLELKLPWSGSATGALTPVAWRNAYVLRLPSRPEDLRFGSSRNHARIKWSIGKAVKHGVVVREADSPAELRAWYQLYLETMRTHALPPRPLRLFEAMWDLLRPRRLMRLLLAIQDGRQLAGSIYVMSGATVFYAFNGCRRGELGLRPNDIIQWQGIVDACLSGYRWYDLGEVSTANDGLADFKAKWGTNEHQLYRSYYPQPVDRRLDSHPPGIRAIEKVWCRLPLPVTAAIGDAIYRFM